MVERVLVTGASGKTGAALVRRLRASGIAVRAGTRKPSHQGDIRFDWRDPTSFDAALDGTDAIYLIAPTDTPGSLAAMQPFLEVAVSAPRRLVLLSASSLPEGGPMMGAVHAWLAAQASDWAVLRPSWFMQNFVTQHLPGILQDGALYSATEDGPVPFIDVEDIAAVAAALLTASTLDPGQAPVLTGPHALSYDAVAEMISLIAKRPVRHVRLSVKALAQRYESFRLPADYAIILAGMDGQIARGAEARTTDEVERWTGRRPNSMQAFLETHRDIFRGGGPVPG